MRRMVTGICILFSLFLFSGCALWERAAFPTGTREPEKMEEPKKRENQIDPASERLFTQAEEAYLGGDEKRALQLAQQAIDGDEKNYKAHSLKGLLLALDGRPDAGAEEIQKALGLHPSYIQGYYEMGLAKKLGGHYEEAIRNFKKVLAADPENTWSLYGIAACYGDMKNKEKALAFLKEAIKSGGDSVKEAAREQDHFAWLREDDAFQRLTQ